MEKILGKVNELETLLIKAVEKEDARAKQNSEDESNNKHLKVDLDLKSKDLDEREEAVAPIENLVAYKEKADKTLKEANERMKNAMLGQEEADKRKSANAREHAEQRSRIAKEDARILDGKNGVKKGYEQLKKAEDASEKKLLRNVVKKKLK